MKDDKQKWLDFFAWLEKSINVMTIIAISVMTGVAIAVIVLLLRLP